MLLLDFPPEILDHIILHTLPVGFESFVLSCKTVYGVGKEHFAIHNQLKRFRYITSHPLDTNTIGTCLTLIREISREPLVALYIEHLDLIGDPRIQRVPWDSSARQDYHMQGHGDSDLADGVAQLLRLHPPYSALSGQERENWKHSLLACDEDGKSKRANYLLVFLFTLLPNLKILQLPTSWYQMSAPPERPYKNSDSLTFYPGLWELLDTYAGNAISASRKRQSSSQTITFLPEGNYEKRVGLRSMLPFLALRSVKELHVRNCVGLRDGYTGIPFEWRYPHNSALRRIDLDSCCINEAGMSELLAHTPNVTSLRYTHAVKWHGCGHKWGAGAFVKAIGRHQGSILQDLTIGMESHFVEVDSGVASMQEFVALKSLDISARVLGKSPLVSTGLPCLSEILPPRVRRVTISPALPGSKYGIECLAALFRRFGKGKRLRLANLNYVDLYCYAEAREIVETVPSGLFREFGEVETVPSEEPPPSLLIVPELRAAGVSLFVRSSLKDGGSSGRMGPLTSYPV